jgi:hypothetical protein
MRAMPQNLCLAVFGLGTERWKCGAQTEPFGASGLRVQFSGRHRDRDDFELFGLALAVWRAELDVRLAGDHRETMPRSAVAGTARIKDLFDKQGISRTLPR